MAALSASPSRIDEMDLIKAFGIIAVVLGHAGSPLGGYVYLYHLALFLFVAGYLFDDRYVKDPFVFIGKRVKSLLAPYLSYELVFLALHNVLFGIGLLSDHVSPAGFLQRFNLIITFNGSEQLVGAFWFILLLFVASVAFVTIGHLSHRISARRPEAVRALLVLAAFGLGAALVTRKIYLAAYLDLALLLQIIMYAGLLFRRVQRRVPVNAFLGVAALALLIVLPRFGAIELSKRVFTNPAFFLVASLTGIYVNLCLAKAVLRFFRPRALLYLGRSTLTVFALHFVSFKVVTAAIVALYGMPRTQLAVFPALVVGGSWWWLAYTVAGVVLPVSARYALGRLRTSVRVARRPERPPSDLPPLRLS